MATLKWDQTYYHNDNASFRIWGKAVSDALSSMLVRTADTGQIDWSTAAKPGPSTAAGYEVYRFDDPLQATAPVFIKIEYGTASGNTTPCLYVTVAEASNGAGGMIGGSVSSRYTLGFNSMPPQYLAYPSYICVQPGYFMMVLAGGLFGNSTGAVGVWLVIERVRDDAGVILAEGTALIGGFAASIHYLQRNVQPKDFLSGGPSCLVPGSRSTSQIGNEVQVYRHYTAPTPITRNLIGICTHMKAEIPAGTLFNTALMNGESHTYLAMAEWAVGVSASQGASHCAALRFE